MRSMKIPVLGSGPGQGLQFFRLENKYSSHLRRRIACAPWRTLRHEGNESQEEKGMHECKAVARGVRVLRLFPLQHVSCGWYVHTTMIENELVKRKREWCVFGASWVGDEGTHDLGGPNVGSSRPLKPANKKRHSVPHPHIHTSKQPNSKNEQDAFHCQQLQHV
ncbi:hypothetical protein BC830DRAFT_1158589 [Chytriomyces sp. MP71]|nr:hypothetical protein BC830DRAFT_1158589 [Chytriomyces sp. MP71]